MFSLVSAASSAAPQCSQDIRAHHARQDLESVVYQGRGMDALLILDGWRLFNAQGQFLQTEGCNAPRSLQAVSEAGNKTKCGDRVPLPCQSQQGSFPSTF